MDKKTTNKTRSPVEGPDFYGGEKEIAYVWQRIYDGNNIILSRASPMMA